MTSPRVDATNVRDLFHEGKLNSQDDRGFSCLHWLVVTGNDRQLRKVLLLQGADPSLRDAKSLTALDRACKLGRYHMIHPLVEALPESLNAHRDTDGRTPLHFANESMQAYALVPLLLELGADVEARSRLGRTILHECILRGSDRILMGDLVTRHGANIEARDNHGWTPLHFAAYLGHVDMVKQLLKLGANPRVRDLHGRTPLHLCASKMTVPAQWDQDVTVMLECSSCAQAQEMSEWARRFCRPKPIEIAMDLVDYGATVWTTDFANNLPFFLAARVEEVDITFAMIQVAAMEGLFG